MADPVGRTNQQPVTYNPGDRVQVRRGEDKVVNVTVVDGNAVPGAFVCNPRTNPENAKKYVPVLNDRGSYECVKNHPAYLRMLEKGNGTFKSEETLPLTNCKFAILPSPGVVLELTCGLSGRRPASRKIQ